MLDSQFIREMLALANTTYNVKSGAIIVGQPLQYQQDIDLVNMSNNSLPIDTKTPTGFSIIHVENQISNGLQSFAAYNKDSNTIKIAISGVDGYFIDQQDTAATTQLAVNQLKALLVGDPKNPSSLLSSIIEQARDNGGLANLKVEIAGQSMGGRLSSISGNFSQHIS